MIVVKAHATTFSTSILSSSSNNKTINKDISKELIKDIKELKTEINALKKNISSSTSQPIKGSKEFVVKCIWYNDPNYKCGDYGSYEDAMKNDIITFNKDRIRDATTNEPLDSNFERSGMKKLIKNRLRRNNSSCSKETKTFTIEIDHSEVKTPIHISEK